MTRCTFSYLTIYCVILAVTCKKLNTKIQNKIKEDPLVVQIEDGIVRGKIGKTIDLNRTYYAFQGIPYAQPPVGNLRFSPPIPASKWNGTLNATQDASQCTQGFTNTTITGSEDCLYINVYTPKIANKNMSVMVYIYGGFFWQGSSSYENYGPDFLLDQDIVYVSFNYRLGIFGFLSTGDLWQPGNNGLRDQILALQWVQTNIAHFGGNPKSVTVFGESAGSASVSYLLESNLTKGLFHRAILESGSSLCLWALTKNGKEIAGHVKKALNLNATSSQSLIQQLRTIDSRKLQQASLLKSIEVDLFSNPFATGLPFAPVSEPEHEGAVFSGKSQDLLTNGKFHQIPTIIGFNSNEAAAAFNSKILNEFFVILLSALYLTVYDVNQKLLVPPDMNVQNTLAQTAAGVSIHFKYFGILPMSIQKNKFAQFASDDFFVRPIRETVKQQSKYAPVYYYRFSYEGGLGGISNRTMPGVAHGEDLGYIFNVAEWANKSASQADILTRNRVVKLWTNFAKYGNPTPQPDNLFGNVTWYSSNIVKNNLVYLDINTDVDLQMNPEPEYMKFWDDLYAKYGQPPYGTY